jgi:hypothetical protein
VHLLIYIYNKIQKFGILLQGPLWIWTKEIILNYKNLTPNCILLLSTWDDENTDNLNDLCTIIKLKRPKGDNRIQFQKIGTLAGLELLDCETILICRTDQFIDAPHMFQMFSKVCKTKIVISNYATLDTMDYFASTFCQVGQKNVLFNFWTSIDVNIIFDKLPHPEQYMTKCYLINYHKDNSNWKIALKKYFYVADWHIDWKIRWLKLETNQDYKNIYFKWYPKCVNVKNYQD